MMRIALTGDLDADDAKLVASACINSGEVELVITGPGGDALALVDAVEAIRGLQAAGGTVTTRVLAYAASAHAILFAAGDRRILHEGAALMVHPASASGVQGNRHEISDSLQTLAEFDVYATNVIHNATGVERALAERWFSQETWFSIPGGDDVIDALAVNFATETADPVIAADRLAAHAYGFRRELLPDGLRRNAAAAQERVVAHVVAEQCRRATAARMSWSAAKAQGPGAQSRVLLERHYNLPMHKMPVAAVVHHLYDYGQRLLEADG